MRRFLRTFADEARYPGRCALAGIALGVGLPIVAVAVPGGIVIAIACYALLLSLN